MKSSVKQLIFRLLHIFPVIVVLLNSVSLTYAAEPDKWTWMSSMAAARYRHTAIEADGKIYVMGGMNASGGYLNSMEIYDIAANTWAYGKNMPVARGYHTATYANGKIYLIGGINSSGYIKPVSIYDIATNTWTSGPNMTYTRIYHTATYYDGNIYIMGGQTDSAVIKVVYFYDIANNVWKSGASMNYNHNQHASVFYDGKIYVIGGNGATAQERYQSILEIYDINLDSWSIGESMTVGRHLHGAVEVDGLIYVMGGSHSNLTNDPDTLIVEAYDIANNSWSSKESIPRYRKGSFGCLYVNGKIYLIGGQSGSIIYPLKTMDIYDVKANRWSNGTNMNYYRDYNPFIYYNNSIYAIGGQIGPGSASITPTVEVYGIGESASDQPTVNSGAGIGGSNSNSYTGKGSPYAYIIFIVGGNRYEVQADGNGDWHFELEFDRDLAINGGQIIIIQQEDGKEESAPLVIDVEAIAFTVNVNFDPNGGNTPSFSEKTVTYNNPYGELPTVSRDGYTFGGWHTE